MDKARGPHVITTIKIMRHIINGLYAFEAICLFFEMINNPKAIGVVDTRSLDCCNVI